MKKYPVIGIAGYMGSGKSTLAKAWAEKINAHYIDVDAMARILMIEDESIVRAVGELFPVVEKGKIDFAKLGAIVFSSDAELKKLNDCVHPPLLEKLNDTTSELSKKQPVIVDAALLTLWGDKVQLDQRIWINASVDTRLNRFMNRTGLSQDESITRITKQMELFGYLEGWGIVENETSLENALQNGVTLLSKFVNE